MSANLRSMLDCIDEEAELLLQSTAEDSIVHRRCAPPARRCVCTLCTRVCAPPQPPSTRRRSSSRLSASGACSGAASGRQLRVCRARQIALSLQRFQQQAVAASLRQSVMGIEEGNGTAGNFFRIARRTHLARAATLDSSAVPPAPEPLRNASSLRS